MRGVFSLSMGRDFRREINRADAQKISARTDLGRRAI